MNRKMCGLLTGLREVDHGTWFHSMETATVATSIGRQMCFGDNELEILYAGALLHDIGKLMIRTKILAKPSKLTMAEYEIMRRHPENGFDYEGKLGFPTDVKMIALQHHERLNGSGYPYHIKGDKITLYSKIVAIADVYVAMTEDRPYRKGLTIQESMEYICKNAGLLFDKSVVKAFGDLQKMLKIA